MLQVLVERLVGGLCLFIYTIYEYSIANFKKMLKPLKIFSKQKKIYLVIMSQENFGTRNIPPQNFCQITLSVLILS